LQIDETLTYDEGYGFKVLNSDGSIKYSTSTSVFVEDAINNGVTDKAPSENAVFDALANKQAYDPDLTTWAGITPATGIGTFLATPSSANLAAAVTDATGSAVGGVVVFNNGPNITSPNLTTPTLGVATATTINGNAITTGTGTLTLGSKTLTVSNTLILTGTDSSSVAFGAGGTVAYANDSRFMYTVMAGYGLTTQQTLADSTTYFFGLLLGFVPTTSTNGSRRIQISTAGNVTNVSGIISASNMPTTETITITIKNVTTAATTSAENIAFQGGAAQSITFNITFATPVSVSINNFIEVQLAVPSMTTNPTNTYASMYITIST